MMDVKTRELLRQLPLQAEDLRERSKQLLEDAERLAAILLCDEVTFLRQIPEQAKALVERAQAHLDEAEELARELLGEEQGTVLGVPYLSQWGTGADERRGDCGPACVAMLAHFLTGHRPTVDQAAAACGQPKTAPGSYYTGHGQLIRGAAAYGFELVTRSKYRPPQLTVDLIMEEIDAGRPVIALVHYGVLRDWTNGTGYVQNQDQNFGRGHWFLVVGYRQDEVIVNDPDFWGNRAQEGDHRAIPVGAFEKALGTVAPGCTVGYQGLTVKG